jgi:hypothetical protein
MLKIDGNTYRNALPFPYASQDTFLDDEFAKEVQKEIMDLSDEAWDRYDNPFEQKFTLRDKWAFPPLLTKVFEFFESADFMTELSALCGYELIRDETRNFWGVHKYKEGDYLDIHVDAGIHPKMGLKKQLTLGLYLSAEWKEDYGCKLEIWNGTNAGCGDPRIIERADAITPAFNRLVLFTCNDYAWHGNPEPATCGSAQRIFVTISYMSRVDTDLNKRVKAYFVRRPTDPVDVEKDRLRLLRADPEKFKEVYRM